MRFPLTIATVCALLVSGMLPGFSAEAAADPKAGDILKAASDYLARGESLRVKVDVYYFMMVDDEEEDGTTEYVLDYTRPGHISLHLENSNIEALWVANDSGLTTYIPEFGQYTVKEKAPDPVDLISRAGFSPIQSAATLLAEFVKDTPFGDALSDPESISYEGIENIDGVETHHLQLPGDWGEWDIWIETGDKPLVRRIHPDVTEILFELEAQADFALFNIEMNFGEWTLNASEKSAYTFVPKPGATKVARFQPPEPEPEAMRLLGKRAPEFTLDLMNGGTLDLASKIGEEIVVLDFWATWCGPCRRAMPIISRVTDEFADDDVRLYAVNLQETVSEINEFLRGESLDVMVALDTEGTVSEQYKAYSIPQTVIIGKDGTVQVIHIGIGPTLEDTLRDELARLVNGEVLAAAR